MREVIRVRLLGRSVVRGGALYNAGEIAAFPPEIAEELVSVGAAEVVEPNEENEEGDMAKKPAKPKAVTEPPVHKQIKWAPNKGGR